MGLCRICGLYFVAMSTLVISGHLTRKDTSANDPPWANSGDNCTCLLDQGNDTRAENANQMKENLKNMTTWLSKARHRATHSRDAFEASVAVGALVIMILFGVYFTKMWEDKSFQAIQQKQPVKYEHHNPNTDMLVKG